MKILLPLYKNILLFFNFVLLLFFSTFAQNNVGIGTTTPHISSILELQAEDKGLLTPRMNASQRMLINNPANGLLVFDTDSSCYFFFSSSSAVWINLCDISALATGPAGPPGPPAFDPCHSDGLDNIIPLNFILNPSSSPYVVPAGFNFHASIAHPSWSSININGNPITTAFGGVFPPGSVLSTNITGPYWIKGYLAPVVYPVIFTNILNNSFQIPLGVNFYVYNVQGNNIMVDGISIITNCSSNPYATHNIGGCYNGCVLFIAGPGSIISTSSTAPAYINGILK